MAGYGPVMAYFLYHPVCFDPCDVRDHIPSCMYNLLACSLSCSYSVVIAKQFGKSAISVVGGFTRGKDNIRMRFVGERSR